jgi:exodeoxyribonuclease VII large subunit
VARSDVPTLSVAELCEAIRAVFESAFPGEVWVRGEIHDLKRPPTGHVYFDLLDPAELGRNATAKLAVALFANNKFRVNAILKRAGSVRMTDGVEVRIRGRIEFHAPSGKVSFLMTLIDPEYTLGRLAADRDRLLADLAKAGLLDRQRRLAVPVAPLRVGLVTSLGSAAAEDFLAELRRSGFGFDVVAVDTRVQGDGAVANVVAALHTAARSDVDVVALVRGGGARTDLATFDHADIARAVASLEVPVWCGIGHEIDRSVVDEVAHTSFKTPTACAAALVDQVGLFLGLVVDRWAAIARFAGETLTAASAHLDRIAARAGRDTAAALRVAEAGLDARAARLTREGAATLRHAASAVEGRAALVAALDPTRTLARGWSITRGADGRVIRDAGEVQAGEELVSVLARGSLRSTVSSCE